MGKPRLAFCVSVWRKLLLFKGSVRQISDLHYNVFNLPLIEAVRYQNCQQSRVNHRFFRNRVYGVEFYSPHNLLPL